MHSGSNATTNAINIFFIVFLLKFLISCKVSDFQRIKCELITLFNVSCRKIRVWMVFRPVMQMLQASSDSYLQALICLSVMG